LRIEPELSGSIAKSRLITAARALKEQLNGNLRAIVVVGNGHELGYLIHALGMETDVADSHVDAGGPISPRTPRSPTINYGTYLADAVRDGHTRPEKITFFKGRPEPEMQYFFTEKLQGINVRDANELRNARSPARDIDVDALEQASGLPSSYGHGDCKFEDLKHSLIKYPPVALGLFEIMTPALQRKAEKGQQIPQKLAELITALYEGHAARQKE